MIAFSSSRVVLDMASITFVSKRVGQAGGILVFAAILFGILAGPVMGQSYRDGNSRADTDRFQQRTQDRRSPSDLPDWAEPAQPQSRNTARPGQESAQKNAADPPPLPDPPSRVPVDGGLALLAAAGAGYAVRKLNEEDDDEEPLA